jgi:hypothetical protein
MDQYPYPFGLLVVRAVAFTIGPIYFIFCISRALWLGQLNWMALLFWSVLIVLFLWHGIACVIEVRKRWNRNSDPS